MTQVTERTPNRVVITTDWKGCHTATVDDEVVNERTVGILPNFFQTYLFREIREQRPLIQRAIALNDAFDQADREMSFLQKVCRAVHDFFFEKNRTQSRLAWHAGPARTILRQLDQVERVLNSPNRNRFLGALYRIKRQLAEASASQLPEMGTEEDYRNDHLAPYTRNQWNNYFAARATLEEMNRDPIWAEHKVDHMYLDELSSISARVLMYSA